jgi:hypothetical protein
MGDAFKLEIDRIEDVFKRFEQLENNLTQGVDDELNISAEAVARNAKRNVASNGTFDEGALAGRINADTSVRFSKTVGANVFYAPYIEFGTKGRTLIPSGLEDYAAQFKGGGGGNFKEFIAAITAWIKRKGIKTGTYSVKTRRRIGNKAKREQEDKGLAYAIALSIRKKGIKARPFMFPAYMEEKTKLLKTLADMLLKK